MNSDLIQSLSPKNLKSYQDNLKLRQHLYFILVVYSALSFAVNVKYDQQNAGIWTPYYVNDQFEQLKHRPYQIIFYVIISIASLIFFTYMCWPQKSISEQQQWRFIFRWFAHLIASVILCVVWLFNLSQLYIMDFYLDFAKNSNWTEPLHSLLYGLNVGLGLLLAIPSCFYLLVVYFRFAQLSYKTKPINTQTNPIYNKIAYFATYVSVIIIMSVNLAFQTDYQQYYKTLPPITGDANLQSQLLLPVTYIQYIFSGLNILLITFLAIKQIYQTEKNVNKALKRHLLIITIVLASVGILFLNRVTEIHRYDKVIDDTTNKQITQQPLFITLYNHLKNIMWAYIFLLFPILVYSVRNKWIQWRNSITSEDNKQQDHPKIKDQIHQDQIEKQQQVNKIPNEEKLDQNSLEKPLLQQKD